MNFIPQDHKNLIYCLLDIRSLVNLRETCHAFGHDHRLIYILVRKIVDSYFYIRSSYTGVIHKWDKFQYLELFYDLYIQRLKKISFQDIRMMKIDKNHAKEIIVNNNGTEIVSDGYFRHKITYFMDRIYQLSLEEKKEIVSTLICYIEHLWKYADEHNQEIFQEYHYLEPMYFDFYPLYRGMLDVIQQMFIEHSSSPDLMYFIIEQLENLCIRNKYGGVNMCRVIFELLDFLHVGYDLVKIVEIAEIFDYISETEYLELFLKKCFEDFLDLDMHDLDDMVSVIGYQLKIKLNYSEKTLEERLFRLMKKVEPLERMVDDFKHAMNFRFERHQHLLHIEFGQ